MSAAQTQKYFKITEAARKLGLSSETLRRWEKAGKITFSRTPGGKRLFSEADLASIRNLLKPTHPVRSRADDAAISNWTQTSTFPQIPQTPQTEKIIVIKIPRVKLPKLNYQIDFAKASVAVMMLILLTGNLFFFLQTPYPKEATGFAEQQVLGAKTFGKEASDFAGKQVLGIETFVAPLLVEGQLLVQTTITKASGPITRFISYLGSSFNSYVNSVRTSPLIVTLFGQEETQEEKEEQQEQEQIIEKIVTQVSEVSDIPSDLLLTGLTISDDAKVSGDLTVIGSINTNTLTSSKLVFSGDAPSIYPSASNSKISLNASGTGAINIGDASTGDIYLAGGAGSTGCTITNSNGSLNCSSNITSAGDLIANGGDIFTDSQTFNINVANTGTINFKDGTNNLLSITDEGTTGSISFSGTTTFKKAPTLAHTGTWAIDSSTWNVSNATLYINPSSATADSNLLGVAVNGGVKFAVDAEGDIYGRNLILAGNTTTGTTTVSGDLTVEGNTTLGDATTDTLTINPATITLAGGNKTLDITGAATRTLTILNSTASQVADIDLSDGSLKVNGTSVITNARAGSFTDIAGTITTASQTNVTAVGTLTSLAVTGNVNSTTGALQTNSITRIDNSGNLTAGTGAFSGTVTIGSGTGKITVGTIDPPYTIDGEKYATYFSGMIGVNEETAGTIRIKCQNSRPKDDQPLAEKCKHEINFNNLEKGSDLWLFYQVTDFGRDWTNLIAVLTPNFNGRAWYIKDSKNKKLTIFSDKEGEISYHFISPRFDYLKWTNTRTDEAPGFILSEKR